MNTIIIEDDFIKNCSCQKNIEINETLKNELFSVNTIEIHFKENGKLCIKGNQEETKLKIIYSVDPNVKAEIIDMRKLSGVKIAEEYHLKEKSELHIIKFYEGFDLKKQDTIYMEEKGAKIFYVLKSLASGKQRYNTMIYHRNIDTSCEIYHHGVSREKGCISFDVTNIIEKGMKNTYVEQQNRIITSNMKLCKINPNLIVDEQDVIANHSAHLGDVDNNELFYLMTRGINKEDARNLLIRGFLLDKIKEEDISEIKDFISFDWR